MAVDKVTFSLHNEDPFLSLEERKVLTRLLSHPEDFPNEFWSAVSQKQALDGLPIPQSQVQGLAQIKASHSVITTSPSSETTTSTSFVDLATPGPTISGLSNGTYLVMCSAWMFSTGAGEVAMMVPYVNGASAGDFSAAFTGAASPGGTFFSVSSHILAANNNNTITAKYRVHLAGTGTFNYRNIMALKIGN